MAKSDFKCDLCNKVISSGILDFFEVTAPHKYSCPKCGTICGKHINHRRLALGLLSPKCEKCGSKVLVYKFEKGRWIQC